MVGGGLATHGLDFGDNLFGRRRRGGRAVERATKIVDHHLGPFVREEQRVLASDASTSTRDYCDATFKSAHDILPKKILVN
jgi:hypothetical protein